MEFSLTWYEKVELYSEFPEACLALCLQPSAETDAGRYNLTGGAAYELHILHDTAYLK